MSKIVYVLFNITFWWLIVCAESIWFFQQHGVGLFSHSWKLIHVITAAMVSLVLRVGNSLAQTKGKCIIVWALDTNRSIVFLKVFTLSNLLKLLLECILNLHRQTSKVFINFCIKL